MTSTVAPTKRNGTEKPTVIRRAASAVTDVGAQARTTAADATTVVAKRAPAALAMSAASSSAFSWPFAEAPRTPSRGARSSQRA